MSFSRAWLYAIGGLIVVTAALASFGEINGPQHSAPQAKEPAAIRPGDFTDDVSAMRANSGEAKNFPAFAPDGVIVVRASSSRERAVARTAERATPETRADSLRQRVQASEPRLRPPSATVARVESEALRERDLDEPLETSSAESDVGESQPYIRPLENEAPEAGEYERASVSEANDRRSWYGSPAYRREVEERRRAEREARRRNNRSW
jgi:hypothetical protein